MGGFICAGGGALAAHVVGLLSGCDIFALAARTQVRCAQRGTAIAIVGACRREVRRHALVHQAPVHHTMSALGTMSAISTPGRTRNNNNHLY
jgi:hypothetical protein